MMVSSIEEVLLHFCKEKPP